MGIAIILIFIPMYLLSIVFKTMHSKSNHNAKGYTPNRTAYFLGFILSLALFPLIFYIGKSSSLGKEDTLLILTTSFIWSPLLILPFSYLLINNQNNQRSFNTAVYTTLISQPWIILLILFTYQMFGFHIVKPFLCNDAIEKHYQTANNVSSIALIPEKPRHNNSPWMHGKFYLNQTDLIYVERTTIENDSEKYEHISIDGKRQMYSYKTGKETKYKSNYVDSLTAEYLILRESTPIPDWAPDGITGYTLKIIKRSNNKTIAETKFYQNREYKLACPSIANNNFYTFNFVTKSLNLYNNLKN